VLHYLSALKWHCIEFKITKNKEAQQNKMLLFLNKIKQIYPPCLASAVHLAYFIVLGVSEVFVAAFYTLRPLFIFIFFKVTFYFIVLFYHSSF